jgi:hypothetical protein
MHPYQVDDKIRQRVFILTAVLAIITARLLSLVVMNLPFGIPWYIEIPGVLGLFGVYIGLYDHILWKCWPFSKLVWFQIPDLNGKWNVIIKSSYGNFEETTNAIGTIRQTASKMCVSLQMDKSFSYSIHSVLARIERIIPFQLIYHYINQPKADAVKTMVIHQGTTWLNISEDLKTMDGDYYSGRGRQRFGTITFTRSKSLKE